MNYVRIGAMLGASALVSLAHAADTDLATVPLITSAPQTVLPNVMFVLDDSGSMAWTHMPDDVEPFMRTSSTDAYGYRSSQCNGVYYNPNITYSAPVKGDGTSYADSSFTAAWINGYNTGLGTVDLSTSFYAYADGSNGRENTLANSGVSGTDTVQAAYYFRYSGAVTSNADRKYRDTESTFYKECNSAIGTNPGAGVFTKVVVGSASGPAGRADERTNFANWFSYYRTRMLMMKTSTGRAFRTIGDRYRVGYMSLNSNGTEAFLNIDDFDSSQKIDWYSKLYSASPSSGTPLREALARAGRIYGGKVGSVDGVTVTDPVQYSCQKNFTILSSDGYWNGAAGDRMDGSTTVGDQDGELPRPYNDGGTPADQHTATITITGGSSSTSVLSVTVNGSEILSDDTSGSNSNNTVASRVGSQINDCRTQLDGDCDVVGFRAFVASNVVTIVAPTGFGPITSVNVSKSGGKTATATVNPVQTVYNGGTANTLADVAAYYYNTDLRDAAFSNATNPSNTNVAENNVIPGGEDDANWQHMTTFTLGLGASGRMIFSPSYKTDATGDYAAVKNGSLASSSLCTWQTAGTACNWPSPAADAFENIDDLWHAAVNGRGTYFSAQDPAGLAVGLSSALQGINELVSDSAAATTSNPNITAGDNYIFSSTFRSGVWYGELERRQIAVASNGTVTQGDEAASPDWEARALLDATAYASRVIYTFDPTSATNKLKPFTWDDLSDAEEAYFSRSYVSTTASVPLSQFCAAGETCLSSTNQDAADNEALVNYIRGDRSNEGGTLETTKFFRQRTSVLGDIVNSEAVYVQKPMFEYADSGYSQYRSDKAGRDGMVYVGANDGMLHAFYAETGQERWAYIPSMLIPNLYRLADKQYATRHQYYVDGSPVQADVYFDGTWHTILVGGLNGGGKGFYALDVTNPGAPKALWEVSPSTTGFASLGFSYGRPEVTKVKVGDAWVWAVLLTSGYNNASGTGDGGGHLYVVNAGTGQLIRTISTGAGSTGAVTGICETAPCPSGLAQIRTWVENTKYDNSTTRVYGGDLFGNVWRFDVNDAVGASGYDAQLLATLRGPTGGVQSVMTKPELGKVGTHAVVFVGTGRYLGASDLSDTSKQSIYGIKDALGSTGHGNPRSSNFVAQTLTAGICPASSSVCTEGSKIRTSSNADVDFATHNGWFVDLPETAERANTDPQLALGTLAVTTNILEPSACTVGGESYVNYLDYKTGKAVTTANGVASIYLGKALATRTVQIRFSDGTVRSLIRLSDNTWQTPKTPLSPTPGGTRRNSWRELVSR